ncbi:dienelactone hydrolase [Flavobacteriaceae bacterium R38]|nr:dienelactone hydrolase [Flavobacteriaceae bacterium R38]
MKKYTVLIFILTSFVSCSSRGVDANFQIGQKSITYVDKSRDRPLITEIWYPTLDTLKENNTSEKQREPFVSIETIPDASMPNQKFPLLMVSHGTGGNRFSLTWFVEKMVKEGYIVITVDHYGNSSFNKIPREFLKWWERAIDIQFLLTQVINDSKIGAKIDISRIGGVGFSLGGYTNIALAGGHVDRYSDTASDSGLPPEFPETDEVINFSTDSLIIASYNKYKDRVKDERIKAFFTMAPAVGFGFYSNEQTKEITAPVFIVAGKGDQNTPIQNNAQNYHQLITTSELHLFDENVGHYVFLNEGTEFGKKILPQLTVDHPNVNRKEIHEKTLEMAIDFFNKNL